MSDPARKAHGPQVALFVTCIVDLFRPSVGFAALKLLEDAGCRVSVPQSQVCCGQPAYNAGDEKNAKAIARQVIAAFQGFDHVVAPSGSCAGMIKHHYPALLGAGPDGEGARELAARTFELTSFMTDVLNVISLDAAPLDAGVTYHDSCSGLRELGVKEQPRKLLNMVGGLRLTEYEGAEACCGFGGTFCVKYPDISNHIVSDRAGQIGDTGADLVLGGDLGCLMNLAGKFSREGRGIEARHIAEVLAGMTDRPAIGRGKS